MSVTTVYTPEVVVETTGLSEEEWLNYRRLGIGGSDAAAVMGQSPFCTTRDLYLDKKGIKPVMDEEESNWVAKSVGHLLEDLVGEIFSKKTGFKIYQVKKMFRHPKHRFMLADVDFMIELPDGRNGLLECKTTNYNCKDKWADDTVPLNYEMQCRHYMAVMNIDVVYIACLYGNNESEYIIRKIERDMDSEEMLIEQEEYFWTEFVEKGIEPLYTEKSDLVLESLRKYFGPGEADLEQIRLDKSFKTSLDTCLELKEKKAALDKEVKKLDEQIKQQYLGVVEELGIRCYGLLEDGVDRYEVTYKPVIKKQIGRDDLERLKLTHEDIYDEFVSFSESRRFTVKKKKKSA